MYYLFIYLCAIYLFIYLFIIYLYFFIFLLLLIVQFIIYNTIIIPDR